MVLAARRSLGRCGSAAVGMILGMDASGHTIRKYELRPRATQLQAFRSHQQVGDRRICNHRPGHDNGMHVVGNKLRSDATNSGIWRAQKLNVAQMLACFTVRPVRAGDIIDDIREWIEEKMIIVPLQVVPSGSARAQVALLDKQIAKLGASTFTTNI